MNNEDLSKRQKEVEARFNDLQKEVEARFNDLQKQKKDIEDELLRLQGEYRAVTQLVDEVEVAKTGKKK